MIIKNILLSVLPYLVCVSLIFVGYFDIQQNQLNNTVPIFPSDAETIIDIYKIYYSGVDNRTILNNISSIIQYNFTQSELDIFMSDFQSKYLNNNIYKKITELITFVNFLWVISLFGMIITSIFVIKEYFPHIFSGYIKSLLLKYYTYLISILSCVLLFQGGYFFTLTSFVIHCALCYHSTKVDGISYAFQNHAIAYMYLMSMCIPAYMIGILLQSQIIGFICVLIFGTTIGVILSSNINVSDNIFDNFVERDWEMISLFMMPIYLVMIFSKHAKYNEPFCYGIYVFSVVTFFINKIERAINRNENIKMIQTIVFGSLFGTYFGIVGLTNTTIIFTGIYFVATIIKFFGNKYFYTIIFLVCTKLFALSWFLLTHPEFIKSFILIR